MVAALSRLATSPDLDAGSRRVVVSWMVEVAEEFGLQQETLHASVSLLDRFLAASNVSRQSFGWLFICFVASRMLPAEEAHTPCPPPTALNHAQGVPRCVLQLVAVGCIFIAAKQLEVRCCDVF